MSDNKLVTIYVFPITEEKGYLYLNWQSEANLTWVFGIMSICLFVTQ